MFEDKNWLFEDAKNTAVYSVRQIVKLGHSILRVSHDRDGDWQFLEWETPNIDDASIVSLAWIIGHDPSLRELFDLPEGYQAVRRSLNEAWVRSATVGDE